MVGLTKGENLLINLVNLGNLLLMAIGTLQGIPNLLCWLKHHDASRNALLHAIHKPRNHCTIICKSIIIGDILDIGRIMSEMSDLPMGTEKGLKGSSPLSLTDILLKFFTRASQDMEEDAIDKQKQ